MISPQVQYTTIERLIVGVRGVPLELVAVLSLCRWFGGKVVFRENDVLVADFCSCPEAIDELLVRLPRGAVTHLWRSGPLRTSRMVAVGAQSTNFCPS